MKDSRHVSPDSASALSESRLALLAAVADPVRQRILALLREQRSVAELCIQLGMAQPRVSHHLAVLRRCGLIVAEVRGRERPHRWASPAVGSDRWRVQELLRSFLADEEDRPRAEAARAGALEDYLL